MSSWNKSTPSLSLARNKTAYVCVVLQGGLGNRILQILAAQHFAEKSGRTFVLSRAYISENPHESSEDTMKQLMSLFPTLKFFEEPVNWNILQEEVFGMYRYQSDMLKRFPGQSILLKGLFFNYRYFPKQIPSFSDPRKFFTYFLHIRLGDYTNNANFDLGLKTYYKRCITDILKMSNDMKFLVFSDEPEKAEEFIKSLDISFKYTVSSSTKSLDVLKEMASCYGGITANSTLSWLGGYLQKPRGNIYMPDTWQRSLPNNQLNEFFPDWVKVISIKEPVLQ
jgi:hypothetical protein